MAFTQPLPKSLSPSRLADFQACPRRYQHASVERIAQPATYATAKGRFVHFVFENLFLLEAHERTVERTREFITPAVSAVLDEQVRSDLQLDDAMLEKMTSETLQIIDAYFAMEDPREVTSEGVELRLGVTVDDTPLFGILDRLDRDAQGNLIIVDYKTGALPNRNFDSQTFANAELYAVLCQAKLGETPSKIRLLYVSHGESVERNITDVVIRARSNAATSAWKKIQRYYEDGDFPATPSTNACRFCAYKEICRSNGVPVPYR